MIAKILEKTSTTLNTAAEWALGAVGMAMALTIAMQVFFRYGLNESLFWSEELGRMLLVWLTFLGASVAYRRGAHIGVDFITARLPEPAARAVNVIVLLVSLFLFAVMAVWGFKFAAFISMQQTASLGVSRQVPFIMVPVGGALMFVHGLTFLMREITGRGAEHGAGEGAHPRDGRRRNQ